MIESDLYDLLRTAPAITALVSARVYESVLPAGAPLPAIVWRRVSDSPINTLGGESDTQSGLYQIDIWGAHFGEVVPVKDAIMAAMRHAPLFTAVRRGAIPYFDEPTGKHREIMDYSIRQ
jgi:hypothetical protein